MRILLVLGVGVVSCLAGADVLSAQASSTVRDSSGVRIVENERGAWTQPWVIREAPITRVEVASGLPDYQASGIAGAVRLSDGTIVVASFQTNELRWYTASGELLRRMGGGRFQLLGHVFLLPGDSVGAVDLLQGRLTVLGPDDAVGRTVHIYGNAMPYSRFADGRYLMKSDWGYPSGGQPPIRVDRNWLEVHLFSEGAGDPQQVLMVPGLEVVVGPAGSPQRDGTPRFYIGPRRFGRNALTAANPSGWVIGDTERAEVHFRRPSGELATIARWNRVPRRVTPEDDEADLAQRLTRWPDPAVREQWLNALVQQPAPPETMPVFGSLVLDPQGNVWAEQYAPPAETPTGRYDVIDSSGVWLGTVQALPGVRVIAVGDDWLLGQVRDEAGVETVLVLAIDKGPVL